MNLAATSNHQPKRGSGRARILAAAVGLTAESGPAGMTINEICARAGVRPPAIYYHFGSKEGLVGAVVEQVADAWLVQLAAAQPLRGGLASRLAAAIDAWHAMTVDPARPMTLLLSVQLEQAEATPEIRAALRRVHERSRQVIQRALAAVSPEHEGLDRLADTVFGLVVSASIGFHLDSDAQALRARLVEIGRIITERLRTDS